MVKRVRTFAGIAAMIVLAAYVAGCKTTTSAGRQVDDATIKTSVKAKLAADVKLSTLTNIEVNSTNAVFRASAAADAAAFFLAQRERDSRAARPPSRPATVSRGAVHVSVQDGVP